MNRWFDKLPIISKFVPGKITLSFLMLLFAIIMAINFRTIDRTVCLFAMFFSFIGDISLNHKREHSKQSTRDLLIGGTAFIIAHLGYCIAYYIKLTVEGFEFANLGSFFAIILLITITVIFLLKAPTEQKQLKLFYFGIMYLWFTGIDYITIFSYAYSVRYSISIIVFWGGMMFLASDLIIGMEKFWGVKSKLLRELVWWLYPIGQIILIAMA